MPILSLPLAQVRTIINGIKGKPESVNAETQAASCTTQKWASLIHHGHEKSFKKTMFPSTVSSILTLPLLRSDISSFIISVLLCCLTQHVRHPLPITRHLYNQMPFHTFSSRVTNLIDILQGRWWNSINLTLKPHQGKSFRCNMQ